MKRFSKFSIAALLVAVSACFMLSCSDSSKESNTPEPEVKPIGTYTMDGEKINIFTGYWSTDGYYYIMTFSPLNKPFNELTTSFTIALAQEFAGLMLNVDNVFHNDDYVFIYDDPTRYYSRYRKLDGGTIYVKYLENNTFDLSLDTKLIDGTPFKIEFKGELTPYESSI